MSAATERLQALKKKLLSTKSSPEPSKPAKESPLLAPAPRPLTRANSPVEKQVKKDKAPLTLRSLMSTRNKLKNEQQQAQPSGSRLKEAPAHRAMLAESRSSIIRSKMISLGKGDDTIAQASSPEEPAQSVAQVIAKFELNPPQALVPTNNPFGFLSRDDDNNSAKRAREWLSEFVSQTELECGETPSGETWKKHKVDQFIAHHRRIIISLHS